MWHKSVEKLNQWQSLTSWERRLLIQMALLLPATWAGLLLTGFKTMHRIALCKLPESQNVPNTAIDATAYADRCAQLTTIAAAYCLPPGSCLPQSLVLCWLLRKKGLDAQIRIGVKPTADPLQAHAWVEYQAKAIGQQDSGYTAFPRLF